MTLKQMATAVRNNVGGGVKGADFTSFSIAQLEDELLINTPAVLLKLAAEGMLDISRVYQRIDGIELECKDLSNNCEVKLDTCAPHFQIPALNVMVGSPVPYLATADGSFTFKVYLDKDYRFHKYRLATSNKPFAWISTSSNGDGLVDVYLFNLGDYEALKFVTIHALFDNPYNLLLTDYYAQFTNAEYYAPAMAQGMLVDSLTQKYVQYYRQLEKGPKPNIQE